MIYQTTIVYAVIKHNPTVIRLITKQRGTIETQPQSINLGN